MLVCWCDANSWLVEKIEENMDGRIGELLAGLTGLAGRQVCGWMDGRVGEEVYEWPGKQTARQTNEVTNEKRIDGRM